MRCAVLGCAKTYDTAKISLHSFPSDPKFSELWVAATGRFNFTPDKYSKICNKHFRNDDYKSAKVLKYDAVPNKNLPPKEEASNTAVVSGTSSHEHEESNTLACIMDPNTAFGKANCMKENTVNSFVVSRSQNIIVSSSNEFFRPSIPRPSDTIVLNYGQKMSTVSSAACLVPMQIYSPSVPVNFVQMQGIQLVNPTSSFALQTQQSAYIQQNNSSSNVNPIKLVDVKKLLQAPPNKNETISPILTPKIQEYNVKNLVETETSTLTPKVQEYNIKKQECTRRKKIIISNPPTKNVKLLEKSYYLKRIPTKLYPKINPPKTVVEITVCHVLDCLRVILPGTFNLTRLIPNEKVASLVIRYLKFDDNNISQKIVQSCLKIIIDAAKLEEGEFDDPDNHPYLKISDKALQLALDRVLPPDFSMVHISTEILHFICVVLNYDILTDGFHILRKKIRKFTSEGKKFNEINNCNNDVSMVTCLQGKLQSVQHDLSGGTSVVQNIPSVVSNKQKALSKENLKNNELINSVHAQSNDTDLKQMPDVIKKQHTFDLEINSDQTKINKPHSSKRPLRTVVCNKKNSSGNKSVYVDETEESSSSDSAFSGQSGSQSRGKKSFLKRYLFEKNNLGVSKTRKRDEDDEWCEDEIINEKCRKQENDDDWFEDKIINKECKKKDEEWWCKDEIINKKHRKKEDDVEWSEDEIINKKRRKKDDDDEWWVNEIIKQKRRKKEEWCEGKIKNKAKNKKTVSVNLEVIVKYLNENDHSAMDVMSNYRLLVCLCRFLHIKSIQNNFQKIKLALQFIAENNVSMNNARAREDEFSYKQNSLSPLQLKGKICDKLKLKPVVLLRNLADYRTGHMLFMSEGKNSQKTNGYHNQRVPFCFTPKKSIQKYSSVHVRKLTDENYKQYRKIIMKRKGNTAVFRIKYTRLAPGSVVFAKDFRCPSTGWVKGTVKKLESRFKYVVRLENGNMWWCTPEQLRPLPDEGADKIRYQRRLIKPKQLFDL